jgi:hypothetical protein
MGKMMYNTLGIALVLSIGIILAGAGSASTLLGATPSTGNMSKAGNATAGNMSKVAGNVTKVGGGVLSNLSKAIGGGLKGLGNLISPGKK